MIHGLFTILHDLIVVAACQNVAYSQLPPKTQKRLTLARTRLNEELEHLMQKE